MQLQSCLISGLCVGYILVRASWMNPIFAVVRYVRLADAAALPTFIGTKKALEDPRLCGAIIACNLALKGDHISRLCCSFLRL